MSSRKLFHLLDLNPFKIHQLMSKIYCHQAKVKTRLVFIPPGKFLGILLKLKRQRSPLIHPTLPQLPTAGDHSGSPGYSSARCTELYKTELKCTQVYLQQQLRRWVGCGHSGGHSRADSVQLFDLLAPDLDQPRAVPLHPNPASPRAIHTEGQLCSLCQQSGRTRKDIL